MQIARLVNELILFSSGSPQMHRAPSWPDSRREGGGDTLAGPGLPEGQKIGKLCPLMYLNMVSVLSAMQAVINCVLLMCIKNLTGRSG